MQDPEFVLKAISLLPCVSFPNSPAKFTFQFLSLSLSVDQLPSLLLTCYTYSSRHLSCLLEQSAAPSILDLWLFCQLFALCNRGSFEGGINSLPHTLVQVPLWRLFPCNRNWKAWWEGEQRAPSMWYGLLRWISPHKLMAFMISVCKQEHQCNNREVHLNLQSQAGGTL